MVCCFFSVGSKRKVFGIELTELGVFGAVATFWKFGIQFIIFAIWTISVRLFNDIYLFLSPASATSTGCIPSDWIKRTVEIRKKSKFQKMKLNSEDTFFNLII